MLFLVVQTHPPETCPAHEGRGPQTLFQRVPAVDVRFAVADVPGHTLVFLVETDSYEAMQEFLEPGRTSCVSEISPVKEIDRHPDRGA